ncbi:PspA/IM30 family protein [Clostridium estertheticum]|uniref:PspA/IM30 family protein n=1 Tax=Clostridium estertheticum TaxID=238834 RepID=UPI0013E94001|nr:PspA/IM30 family protein [Clostridium estertheticum]MBZ9684909.1 PspA/IM30 family protein [Clostridium estertheticum]
MTIINRLYYLIKSKISSILDEFESPLELLDQKIRDMEFILNDAKLSSAKILGNIHEIEKRLDSLSKESDEYSQTIKLALNRGNEALAKKILEKRLDNDKYFDLLNTSYYNATTKGEALKLQLRELQQNIYDMKIYRNEAFARYNVAEAHKKINEIIGNMSIRNNSMCISNIEESLQKKECFISALTELNFDNNLNNEIASLSRLDLNLELKKYM